MSDDYVRLIPTDPVWQPAQAPAAAATAYVVELFAGPNGSVDQVEHEFHDAVTVIDSGVNTSRATCPTCGGDVPLGWVFGVVDSRHQVSNLEDLIVQVPCCGALVSLNELEYDWPMGFARFEISILNGYRPIVGLSDVVELEAVARRLGHAVRQVLAHY